MFSLISALSLSAHALQTEKPPKESDYFSAAHPRADLSWENPPKVTVTHLELQGKTRQANVLILADLNGNIVQIKMIQSTGLHELDQKIISAVKKSKLKIDHSDFKNQQNQQHIIMLSQPFNFVFSPNKRPWWKAIFFLAD